MRQYQLTQIIDTSDFDEHVALLPQGDFRLFHRQCDAATMCRLVGQSFFNCSLVSTLLSPDFEFSSSIYALKVRC